MNKADVFKTHGSNKKVNHVTGIKKNTNYKIAIDNTINWYKKHKIFNLD